MPPVRVQRGDPRLEQVARVRRSERVEPGRPFQIVGLLAAGPRVRIRGFVGASATKSGGALARARSSLPPPSFLRLPFLRLPACGLQALRPAGPCVASAFSAGRGGHRALWMRPAKKQTKSQTKTQTKSRPKTQPRRRRKRAHENTRASRARACQRARCRRSTSVRPRTLELGDSRGLNIYISIYIEFSKVTPDY